MITQGILSLFFGLVHVIIGLLPATNTTQVAMTGILDLIKYGCYFFGSTLFGVVIANVVFWSGVQMLWAVIEWIYKKIPGVD